MQTNNRSLATCGRAGIGTVLEFVVFIFFVITTKMLPFRFSVCFFGWCAERLSRAFGWRRKILNNLELTSPDMDKKTRLALAGRVANSMGRVFVEILSPNYLRRQALKAAVIGPGAELLVGDEVDERPIIFVSGHFGNYDIFRSRLIDHGFNLGALYRPMSNPLINKIYTDKISKVGGHLFLRGRNGMKDMLRHLRAGGAVAMLTDQHMDHGEKLSFFGQPAMTALSAAELALRYDALLIPIYAIRRKDGYNFDIWVEGPVIHSDAKQMMQEVNNSLEAIVRKNMDQWMWAHNRWKEPRVN